MFPRLPIPPTVTSLALLQLLVLKLTSSDSELHLENERLALVLPCLSLEQISSSVDDQRYANTSLLTQLPSVR